MDWLETLLPFILLAIYFLSWLRRQAKGAQKAAPPPRPAAREESVRGPTPFEELVRQIQGAVEEAKQEAARQEAPPAPTPVRPLRPPTTRPSRKPPATAAAREPEFHGVGGFEHDRHGFGPASPFSEEAFERLSRGADVTAHAPGHLGYDPHGLFKPTAAPARKHPLVERLRQSGGAREAVIFREILDRPRARRRP